MSNPIPPTPADSLIRSMIARLGQTEDLERVSMAISGPDDDPVMAAIRRLKPAGGNRTGEYAELKDVEGIDSPAGRNKNPGNLRDPDTGQFARFDSAQEGFRALIEDVKAKQTGNTRTGLSGESSLFQFFSIYAPPHENNTIAYAREVAKDLGVTLSTSIKNLDPVRLAHAIAQFEDRPYYDAITAGAGEQQVAEVADQTKPLTPNLAADLVARPDQTGQVRDEAQRTPYEDRRITEQNISPAGVVTTDIESRRAFLERKQEERAGELPEIGTVSEAPTGIQGVMRWLGNMKFLAGGDVISSGQTPGGVDIGGLARFSDQVMTPILTGGETKDFAGGMKEFVKVGGGLALGIADMFVGAPIKLLYNEASGQDYLLPEEREQMFKSTLSNYAGLYTGLAAGKIFANRQLGGLVISEAAPVAELAAASTRVVSQGWRARAARGAVEGFVGGGVTGALEAPPGEMLDRAATYALTSVPLGIAFEAVMSGSPKRFLNSDAGQQAVAKDLFHLRQLEFAGGTTADQAAARTYGINANPNDLAKAVLRTAQETGEPAIIRGVEPKEVLTGDWPKDVARPTFFKRSDGTWDMLAGKDLTNTQHGTFKTFGFFDQEPVSFLGKDYEYVGGLVDDVTGETTGHVIKDGAGNEIEVAANMLEHGHDITRPGITPDRAQIQNRIYNDFKSSAPQIFEPDGMLSDKNVEGNIDFTKVFNDYVKARNIPPEEYDALARFLQSKFEEDVVHQALEPKEYVTYRRLINETEKYRTEQPPALVELAAAHGMYLDNNGSGGMILRDVATNEIMNKGPFHSPQAAREFLLSSGAAKGATLDGQGFPSIGSKLTHNPSPTVPGNNKSTYNYVADGVLRQFEHYVNITSVGRHTTMIRQVMASYDAILNTEFVAQIWDPLYNAFKRKHAAMRPDVIEIDKAARYISKTRFTEEEIDHLVSLAQTRNADQIINGEFLSRPLTHREIAGANWFKKENIDMRKAFEYRRALYNLEKRYGRSLDFEERVHELQAKMNIDEAHVHAAEIMSRILQKNDLQNLSLLGIVALTEAMQHDYLSPADYIKKYKLSGKIIEAQKTMETNFKNWAVKFDIPEERRLNAYFAHMRRFPGDTPFRVDPDVLPEFVHDLQRTGEMYEYNRNPIDVMMRYVNLGHNRIHVDEPWNAAMDYLTKIENTLPNGKELSEFIKRNYMYDLRGIPHDQAKLSEGFLNKFFKGIGIEISDIDTRKHIVNTALSLVNTKLIGFRLSQGLRDFLNIIQMHYSLLGPKRTLSLLNTIKKYKVDDLIAEGILKEKQYGESVVDAMRREGVTPTLSPVSTLSGGELQAESLTGKIASFRHIVNRVGDEGLKWGLQHASYGWGHAAVYLESYFKSLEELGNMSFGKYGNDAVAAKTKAYKNLSIDMYDVPIIKEFDRLVIGGLYKDAARFLANQTSADVVSVLGLSNNPAGWNTTIGRLWSQYGNWPTQMRSTVVRLGARGSPKQRAAALTRYAMSQASITAASAATGLALNNWYLPYAGVLAEFGKDVGDIINSEEDEFEKNVGRAAARGMYGLTIGTSIFQGGPFMSMLLDAQALANTSEIDDARAADDLVRNWLNPLTAPVPLVAQDAIEAAQYSSYGMSPFNVLARALGIRTKRSVVKEAQE